MKKITLATIKSFICKTFADGALYVKKSYDYDGTIDCLGKCDEAFLKVESLNVNNANYKYNLGLPIMWVVGGGRNYFEVYDQNGFIGFEVSNCCGSYIVAKKIN